MKHFAILLIILGMPLSSFSRGSIESGDRRNIGMNGDANDATGEALEKEKKLCKKYTDLSKQPPPTGPQAKPKAEEHCEKAQQAAGQQGELGKGMGDALKTLASALPALAQLMQKKGNENAGFGADGFVDEPAKTVAALEKAGLSAAEARRYVKNNMKAENDLNSGALGIPSSSGGSFSGGYGSLPSSGSSNLGIEGSAEDNPLVASISGESSDVRPVAAINSGGGADGGGGSAGGGEAPADEFQLDPLPEFSLDKPKSDPTAMTGTSDDFTTLGSEKIGISGDDIFQKLSRRYQYHKLANGFITED